VDIGLGINNSIGKPRKSVAGEIPVSEDLK
jgi:hypothetical protein